jgi:SAM-dependent methyltransferase
MFISSIDKIKLLDDIKRLNDLQPWNHNIQITSEISTKPGTYNSYGKNERKLERLEFLKPLLANKKVMDLGCNEGFFSCKFLEWGARHVTGIDIDEKRLVKARFIKSLLTPDFFDRLELECKSVYEIDYMNIDVDIVFALGFIHRLPNPYGFLQDVLNIKAPYHVFEFKTTRVGVGGSNGVIEFSPYCVDEKDYYGTEYFRVSKEAFHLMIKRIAPSKNISFYDDLSQQRLIAIVSDQPMASIQRKQRLMGLRILVSKFIKDFLRLCIG